MKKIKSVFLILIVVVAIGLFGFWLRGRQRVEQAKVAKEKATIKLTFIEGWTLRDYQDYLIEQGLLKKDDPEFKNLVGEVAFYPSILIKDYRLKAEALPVEQIINQRKFLQDLSLESLEGYLFPDTYIFNKNYPLESLVNMMLNNFEKKIPSEMQQEIRRQGKSLDQIITVASLVEAEARYKEDRQLVADIIWRRFSNAMPLQLDSTVNYVTGGKKPSISLKEQEVPSPFNTYKNKGLPVGPINNPGIESIEAAIYPLSNNYWYFLSGTDDEMHYAKNLDEHNLNKIKYLR
ncbi:MAG: Aminodeoxychorismate lyase [Candidatus Magasanikbacteria bacterium GW2011_GWC2_40_17]|uniref:Endolytic murein transglycosylase n=1 Tax=Candidatus Magasanikbacteria bacterium GW2011_GWA2_42_32 TaxID=1619039 RepID=A0A0G1A6A8_9BACT|nr:MAG: Aminodeoxychorismate lyase [Candidatus Magasanikbacteria bacterium GW2011_GWC2_40_17]KKS56474.1 MAG: Aminodeoxychorismate lyase [Candidatus Magasanikbacteria bacterium GW2011_GWA2_42_32]OGH85059.1 MAG: hypothetical protein A2294_01560 [Candidatus Magasanikbacteria bacterium RIFOXYB2_FULL_38_10]